ncbi:hypothetical protein L218DRAFT_949738 [Marasmius fiardii PR-910]|nr:hypothetical protein L218DRAFT_949738 [Marasmius fiardii PR-910]
MHRFLLLNLWATLVCFSKAISLWDPTGPYHVGYTQHTELASYGYTVIGIDHPGEAPYIPLPDGGGITGASDSSPEFVRAVDSFRVSDVLAVMSDPLLPSLIRDTGAPINTTHFGIFGHSIGGSGAAGVMAANDTKIASLFKVGVNMDGSFNMYTNISGTGLNTSIPVVDLKRPFLELASETHFNGSEEQTEGDPAWAYFDAGQSGWRRALQVNGTLHADFNDLPLWVERLGGRDGIPGTMVGPANGDRVTHVVGSILRKFFGYIEGRGLQAVDEYTGKVSEVLELSKNGEEDGGR